MCFPEALKKREGRREPTSPERAEMYSRLSTSFRNEPLEKREKMNHWNNRNGGNVLTGLC